MKTLRNYIINGALLQADTGPEAQVGDQVRLYLDQEAHPGFPEYVVGTIQHPIAKVYCDSATSYSIEYDEADLLGEVAHLVADDVINATVITAVDILEVALAAETAARIAADASHEADTTAHTAASIVNTPAGNIAATTVQAALNELDMEKAPLASPTFTGVPTAPTAAVDTDTTQIATTAFVSANKNLLLGAIQEATDNLALLDASNIDPDTWKTKLGVEADDITGLGTAATAASADFADDGAVFYAARYGVLADGTTDDTLALQAAINAASSAASATKRSTVVMPAGTIMLSRNAAFVFPETHKEAIELKSNVNIVGQGIGATVLKLLDATTGNCPVMLAHNDSSANIALIGFTVDGNNSRSGFAGSYGEDEGINFKDAQNVLLSQIEIRNCAQEGLDIDEGDRVVIKDCVFLNNYGCGIHAVGGATDRIVINGCRFEGNGFERNGGHHAVAGDGVGAGLDNISTYVVATNCIFYNNCREVNMIGGRLMISDSYMEHNANAGRGVSGSAIEANPAGYAMLTLNNVDVISNINHVIQTKTSGTDLYVSNSRLYSGAVSSYGIQSDNSGKITAVGNYFQGVGGINLSIATAANHIASNVFTGLSGFSLRVEACAGGAFIGNTIHSTAVGLQFRSGSSGWTVQGNNIASNTAIEHTVGGGDNNRIIGNSGEFALNFLTNGDVTGCLVTGNVLGAVAIGTSGSTGNTYERNIIGGTITHTGATFASNTWRRNTGAGCVGIFYGTATLTSGTATVTTAAANSSRKWSLTRQGKGSSTAIGSLSVGTVTAQTSFVIDSLSALALVETGDLSIVYWEILE